MNTINTGVCVSTYRSPPQAAYTDTKLSETMDADDRGTLEATVGAALEWLEEHDAASGTDKEQYDGKKEEVFERRGGRRPPVEERRRPLLTPEWVSRPIILTRRHVLPAGRGGRDPHYDARERGRHGRRRRRGRRLRRQLRYRGRGGRVERRANEGFLLSASSSRRRRREAADGHATALRDKAGPSARDAFDSRLAAPSAPRPSRRRR